MRDFNIRPALRSYLSRIHADASTTPLVLDELELCIGTCRADIAVFNGSLSGYEIKSERDTLKRLPAQVEAYGRVFEYASVVTSQSHQCQVKELIPTWWGILMVVGEIDAITFAVERTGSANPKIDPYAVGMLLWRHEALRLLERLGFDMGVRSKPTSCMVSRLCQRLSTADLTSHVRMIVKSRGDWRVAARQKQYGALSQRSPSSARFQ